MPILMRGLILLFAVLAMQSAQAQSAPEEQVKAAFVFNFAKLLTWPDERFETSTSPLRVCTLSGDASADWLTSALAGKRTGERRIETAVVEAGKASHCHLIYLGSSLEPRFPELMDELSGNGALLVDEGSRFTWPNGMIRLFQEDGRFRFEMNLEAFEAAELRIDPRMIRLARIATR